MPEAPDFRTEPDQKALPVLASALRRGDIYTTGGPWQTFCCFDHLRPHLDPDIAEPHEATTCVYVAVLPYVVGDVVRPKTRFVHLRHTASIPGVSPELWALEVYVVSRVSAAEFTYAPQSRPTTRMRIEPARFAREMVGGIICSMVEPQPVRAAEPPACADAGVLAEARRAQFPPAPPPEPAPDPASVLFGASFDSWVNDTGTEALRWWENLAARISEALAPLDPHTRPEVEPLRAALTAVTRQLEKWRTHGIVDWREQADLALTVIGFQRQIRPAEPRANRPQSGWRKDFWWSASIQLARMWVERISTEETDHRAVVVLQLIIAAARNCDPATLDTVLARNPDHKALAGWIVSRLEDPTAIERVAFALQPMDGLDGSEVVLLRDGHTSARLVLHELQRDSPMVIHDND